MKQVGQPSKEGMRMKRREERNKNVTRRKKRRKETGPPQAFSVTPCGVDREHHITEAPTQKIGNFKNAKVGRVIIFFERTNERNIHRKWARTRAPILGATECARHSEASLPQESRSCRAVLRQFTGLVGALRKIDKNKNKRICIALPSSWSGS